MGFKLRLQQFENKFQIPKINDYHLILSLLFCLVRLKTLAKMNTKLIRAFTISIKIGIWNFSPELEFEM